MRNHLCWDPGAVRRVINPFAEHISDGLFRAVHSDWDLKVSPPVGTAYQDISNRDWRDQSPADFLEDFLRDDRPHALAAILGGTGSGKSHLVHWMRLHIKPSPKRLVIVVPKSGTSLRNIVKMMIEKLPSEQQTSYLDTLMAAGEGMQRREHQREQLLNDIAQAIREEVIPDDADEVEQDLAANLPNLLMDPNMRKDHFLGDNTVIAEIADHIFSPSNAADRPDQRRTFVETDLPLGGMDYVNASQLAKNAIQLIQLDQDEYLPLAVRIINRNLERAIARTLSFSGDRVEELMAEMRRHLKAEGKELVLLVEEFARLQGIDRALLQAITTQGDAEHCRMRTAIAVTTGFFQSVAETAYMRTTHVVDMDNSAGRSNGNKVTEDSLSRFAARYLNAVRLGADRIEAWSADAAPGEVATSACESCNLQAKCHSTFGERDGYGLYPFTSRALWNAAGRVDPSMPERLNPRILQSNLLVEVLDNHGPDIRTGTFPSMQMIKKFGGIKHLKSVRRNELETRNPHNAERWISFLELFDGSGEIVRLDERILQAFDIPEIVGATETPVEVEATPDQPNEQQSPPGPGASRDQVKIDEWDRGGPMDQVVANKLRPLIHAAITDAVDWDRLGLSRAQFVGKSGKAFQNTSIVFDRQSTQVLGSAKIHICIPGDLVTQSSAATALSGLLLASQNQFSWDFEDGDKMLRSFLDCIGTWALQVEEHLLEQCAPIPSWDPGAASLELMFIGAAIGGTIKPDATIAEMIDGAFVSSLPETPASTSQPLLAIYRKLFQARSKLIEVARAQFSSPKGGVVGPLLNPHRTISAIRQLRANNFQLKKAPPEEDRNPIAKLYLEVKATLSDAAQAEIDTRLAWLSAIEAAFGSGSSKADIVEALRSAQSAVEEAGIGSNQSARRLGEALDVFSGVHFEDSMNAARALRDVDVSEKALPHFGRGRRNAINAATQLAKIAEEFLNSVEENISSVIGSSDNQQMKMQADLERIDAALRQIADDINSIASGMGEVTDVA
ncbi:protein DpdH [Salipiger bermudensis]|uniref:protein DpdH n=1 Tax=Salipiger bermudensis TaxID=344736 RepID=UPI00241429C2|nr:protein DpdH [Salipiger bermudensis]